MQRGVQREIICFLPDKHEPIIVPAEIENDVRREYIGHPKELEVRIEPYFSEEESKQFIPQMGDSSPNTKKPEIKKKSGRPKKQG